MKLWIERFEAALELLTTEKPPRRLVQLWADHEDHIGALSLQDWAISNSRLPWLQGIALIEAAETLADHPKEGGDFEYRHVA